MRKIFFYILTLFLFVFTPVHAQETGVHVKYMPHIENQGWCDYVYDGKTAGTEGAQLRLEALKVYIVGDNDRTLENLGVRYRSHVQDYGWQNYVLNGQTSGTTGESKKIEAVQLKLTGSESNNYSIYYRSHVENFGWLGWAKDGSPSGSEGYNYRLEAVEIKILPKDEYFDLKDPAFKSGYGNSDIRYRSYVESIGWQNYVGSGQDSGTTGRNLKLEALTLSLNPNLPEGDILAQAHIEDLGWVDYVGQNKTIGTTGENKRLEALKIKLTGDLAKEYDVKYQVHVQDYGWQNYVTNDAEAGTTGESKKIEAIRIRLVKKETSEPPEQTCTHQETTLKNAVEATCLTEGYTGDIYCKRCGEKLQTGKVLPRTNHKYQEIVKRAAGKGGPGLIEARCSVCGDSSQKEVDYNPTPEQVYKDIMALKSVYPEDMRWTNANQYYSKALNQSGGGCHAFALLCSDEAFGYLPGRKHYDLSQIKVGDILRINQDSHTIVVLEVHPDYIIITEGNYNSDIHWGRKITMDDLKVNLDYVITRYPE